MRHTNGVIHAWITHQTRGSRIRNATERQRNYIAVLFEQLGWDDNKASDWLRERHEIKDLARGVFSARVASEAVHQLEQALLKARRRAADRGVHETA